MKRTHLLQPGWSFIGIVKNIFVLMLFLAFAPTLFLSIKHTFQDMSAEKAEVGFVSVRGMIIDSVSYTKRIEEFAKNPNIKALLLRVDCPGGLPGSSQMVLQEILRFKAQKPVVAFAENVCASGGYYAACGAHKVIAAPSALVGSIGVVMKVPNVEGLLESWKVKNLCIQSGAYKTAGDPMKKIDEREVAYLQAISDDTYRQFVSDVALHRALDPAAHLVWADGKIFTGDKALELGLVDALGGYSDALEAVKELAGITGEVRLVTAKHPAEGVLKYLSGEEEYGSEAKGSLAASVGKFCAGAYQSFMAALAPVQPQVNL